MPEPTQSVSSITADMTVEETASRFPRTVPLFAALNMDTCCGGADSIRKAAADNGHDLETVLEKLSAAIA